nr:hypothetical protein [Tanacetum cinerariifolium]
MTKEQAIVYAPQWENMTVDNVTFQTNNTEQRPLREFLIKFSILNGQRPLTLDFNTFCSSTVLDYNNGKYVAHPTPEIVKKELGKTTINPSYLDKISVLKNSFLVAWRILFTFVIQVLGENYSSTEQVNSIQQLLAYCLFTGTEVVTTLRMALRLQSHSFKRVKSPLSKKEPKETKETSTPNPTVGFEQSYSVSSGIVLDPQDPERNIQLAGTGFPFTLLDKGTSKSQPLPEASNEGTAKTTPRIEGPFGDKDSRGNKPPTDMEPMNPTVGDPLGNGAEYQEMDVKMKKTRILTRVYGVTPMTALRRNIFMARHVTQQDYGVTTRKIMFRWISFDYRVPLGFCSIAGGLDHVNPVIRLPLEHGISRVSVCARIDRQGNFEDPSPIVYPVAANGAVSNFKIQPNLIAILPVFRGHEEPYAHLREFFSIADIYQVNNTTKDGVRLRLFPFSLKDQARAWFISLEPDSIHSWSEMQSAFLDEFYSISKTAAIRNKIKSFRQIPGKQFHEAFSRLKELLRTYPHQDVPKWELVKVFYDGLDYHNQQFVMATSGVSYNAYSICGDPSHSVNNCQSWGAPSNEEVSGVYGNRPRNDPFSESYNLGWRNHPNFRWKDDDNYNRPNNTQQQNHGYKPSVHDFSHNVEDFVTDDEIFVEGNKVDNVKSDSELVNDLLKDFLKPPTQNPKATESPKVMEGGVSSTTTPYPEALEKLASSRLAKKFPHSEDMWETFKQLKINLPLIDVIKQIPAYAKFLKDLCTPKRKLNATLPKKIDLTEHVSAVLSISLPPKFKDPRAPLISVVVGNITIKKALLDLSASINIIPASLVDKYDLGTL